MHRVKEVSFPSMSRCVVFDGFLRPLAARLYNEASLAIPTLSDYVDDLESRDPRAWTLAAFEVEVKHVTEVGLVDEARRQLQTDLEADWNKALQVNQAYGDQIRETAAETQEIPTSSSRVPLGGRGLLSKLTLLQQTVRLETRTRTVKKNGKTEYSDWADTGLPTQKLAETAFRNFSTAVPAMMGTLLKRSPSLIKTVVTFGAGVFQERTCAVKEGHLVWWDSAKTNRDEHEVSGAVNFLINRAVCEEDPDNPSIFIIRPALPTGWVDSASFSGGSRREVVFNVSGSQYTREQWVECLRKNIDFANLAAEQVGHERIVREVGTQVPTLAQALYNIRH